MYSQHYTYVQVKVWSDLPSEIFVIHVADLSSEDLVVRTYGWTSTSALVTFREQKKIYLLQCYGYETYSNNSVNCLRITKGLSFFKPYFLFRRILIRLSG